jgi:hypothetical protein
MLPPTLGEHSSLSESTLVMRHRAPLAAVLAAVVALFPGLALPALAGSTEPGSDAAGTAAASGPKVVIVVGATHEATDSYRDYANLMYAEAIRYTSNVVRVYSPNATWKNVKAAAQGASILIYLGHGSGYPRDDSAVFNPDGHDGMGLNVASNKSDYVARYYGESYMANDIRLAKNAVVILSHLCFASGNSMSGDPEPTYAVAEQRIDNFASGFLRAGARTVIADVWNSGAVHYIRSIFTTDQSIGNMWSSSPSDHGHQMPFTPLRNPAYQAVMDPNTWTTGFYRSIVGALDMRTTAVLDGAAADATSRHPATFQAPGAAAVGDAPVSLYQGAALGESTGASLAAGVAVRVMDVVPAEDEASDPSLEVETLDGSVGGWVGGAGLIPRDSAGPELWSMDGARTISPNFDGYLDRLNLWARFSETVDWSVRIRDAGGDVVRTQDGTGHQAGITWDALSDGEPAPDGDYTWHLKANDAWGNPVLDEDGGFTIENEAVPGTAVLSLEPEAPTTRASSTTFTLTFAGPVTGLTKADFTRTGTARCDLGKPAGGPAVYTVTLSDCSTGSATLTLASSSVTDEAAQVGPAGAIASKITIDRSDPSASTPKPTLRKGIQIGGGANAPLTMTLSWTGSDSGSGVASYDVRQSVDGSAWATIASKTTDTVLQTSVSPGHAYRFMVRARDRAGNVGSWSGGWAWYPQLVQESHGDLAYTGGWSSEDDGDFSADGARFATDAGATVKYTFSGRAVSWVTQLGPDSGEVEVYLDGDLVATVDTHADATIERFVAFTRGWSSDGKHTIKLVVVGTGRVDLDAFEVIR